MPGDELRQRDKLILHAIVHTYITTAEAVGSRTIVRKYGLELSPATVRNVMADLEDAGFLQQLHASSGRVPTDKGYRYYVDYLMRIQELTAGERIRIETELARKLNDADQVLRQTSQLLALVSRQTGLVEGPDDATAELRHIQLVPVSPSRVGVMLVDNCGRIRTETVYVEGGVGDLGRLDRFLNDNLRGVPTGQLHSQLRSRLHQEMDEQRAMTEDALRIIDNLPPQRPPQLYLEGATQLFEQPEFRDVGHARVVFGLLDERDRLTELLRDRLQDNPAGQASVIIGAESNEAGMEDLSLVASSYNVGEEAVGMLGVLGPRRMPYSRLTSVVSYTAGLVSKLLTKLAG